MGRFMIIGIAVVVLTIVGWGYFHITSSRSHVPSGPAVSITVFNEYKPLATITNAVALAVVTEMLRSGRPVELHSCTPAGHIEARFASGETLSVGFGPGHDESRYEFGMENHLFSVSRSQFLGGLKSGGVDVERIRTE
jgi:hypothetical protein